MHIRRTSTFLVMLTLIAGMAGCGGSIGIGSESYTLAINSTAGGVVNVNNVTIPSKAIFTYDAGTLVKLTAVAEKGYTFVNWNGDVATIANVNNPVTTITMYDNYSINAEFAFAVESKYTSMVAAGFAHTVRLMPNGTVVVVGDNCSGQCDVSGWTNIVQIAAREYHTVGLKADGTVVAVGNNSSEQCNVGRWADIVQVAAGE